MKTRRLLQALIPVAGAMACMLFAGHWHLSEHPSPKPSGQATTLDASSLQPGSSIPFVVENHAVTFSIPEGEGHSFGSMHIDIPSLNFSSGPVERDGSIENIWVDDVNGDGKEDAIIVVRNAGSGAYVSLVVLESGEDSYSIRPLPDLSSDQKTGYMGHDTIGVKAGLIVRSFPTYEHQDRLRIDRQWKASEAMHGKTPIKVDSDTNADPSGPTRHLTFNYQNRQWEER